MSQAQLAWYREMERRGALAPIASHDQPIEVRDGLMLWVGKKRFCRLQIFDPEGERRA